MDPLGEIKDMYAAYNEAVLELADKDSRIVLLYSDYPSGPTGDYFRKHYTNRIYDFGIAEANLMSIAAGLAATGKVPFTHCHSIFAIGRAYNQIRQNIAYDRFNVKLVLPASGMLTYAVGASHQTIEDTAALRVIPNLVIITPADAAEAKKATKAALEYTGPVAIRLARTINPSGVPTIFKEDYPFQLGKTVEVFKGDDVTVIASGILLGDCINAIKILAKEGIKVRLLDMHTVKPVDEDAIIKAARETGAIVTVEDVSVIGGLGSAVSEVLSEYYPVPIQRVGVRDRFGQSGTVEELKVEYGLTSKDVTQAVKEVMKKRLVQLSSK
jgi:transketolase